MALLAAAPAAAQAPALLPTPAAMTGTGEGFVLGPRARLVARDAGERNAAARFSELMASAGVRLASSGAAGRSAPVIRFVRRPGLPAEGYRLTTNRAGATITASDDAGLLYAGVTLWQLAMQRDGHHVAGLTIEDRPRFVWRGLLLDSARHFQSIGYIRHLIDWMAANKLNRLQWHLVDDQGWRLEIRKYPRLTSVSAWRRPATAPGAPPLPVTGGFYTQAEVRALVAYAAARNVRIVPEIEMPGHALAAIRAYPWLGVGVPIPEGVWSDWGVFPWLYNPDERTFAFLRDVLTEVMALFPSRDIHVGGDEAIKDQWRASPAVQAKIKALGLKDANALQGWFTARIGKFLAAHGRRLIGWDEILDGGVPADAAITSWRGVEGAIKAARTGHDAILSPAPVLYLDNRQGTGPEEPPGRGNLVTLADVLAFDPAPAALTEAEQRHILGLQANLWTEHVRTEDRAAWMTFPRAAAIAEIGWSPPARRDLTGFLHRLTPQLDRMAPLGLVAADSATTIGVTLDADPASGAVTASLATQAGLPIHFTLDGAAPTVASPLYTSPLVLTGATRLRAAVFDGVRALPGMIDRQVDAAAARRRTSRELLPCSAGILLDLEDDFPAKGPRADFLLDIMHPCWRWTGAPVGDTRAIAVNVGQLPFNFQIGDALAKISFRPPITPAGEVEVRDGCDGPLLATLPLAPAVANPGVTRLTAPLSAPLSTRSGRADLCITYNARSIEPLWAVDSVELLAR